MILLGSSSAFRINTYHYHPVIGILMPTFLKICKSILAPSYSPAKSLPLKSIPISCSLMAFQGDLQSLRFCFQSLTSLSIRKKSFLCLPPLSLSLGLGKYWIYFLKGYFRNTSECSAPGDLVSMLIGSSPTPINLMQNTSTLDLWWVKGRNIWCKQLTYSTHNWKLFGSLIKF